MKCCLLVAVALTTLGGCGADPISASRVHIVGDYGSWNVAFHWSEGGLSILDEPDSDFHALATSVAVADGTVVVGGSYDGKPCYWEDGVRHDLACDTGDIAGVAVSSGGQLILAGVCDDEASVWTDGARAALAVPVDNVGTVSALAVAGDAVHAAGSYRSADWSEVTPCVWRDGERSDLAMPSGIMPGGTVRVTGMALSGSTIVVSGAYDSETAGAGYWSGTAWNDLDGTSARDIAADGDTVYVAGRDADGACYWKNGDKTPLQCQFSTIATAIAAADGAVVVGGKCGAISQPDHIGYWPDDDFVEIHEHSVADINGIFVAD